MLNVDLTHGLAILLLGIFPRETRTRVHIKPCTQMVTAALFIIAPERKQPKCVTTGEYRQGIQHSERHYSALKRNNVSIYVTTMHLSDEKISIQNI